MHGKRQCFLVKQTKSFQQFQRLKVDKMLKIQVFKACFQQLCLFFPHFSSTKPYFTVENLVKNVEKASGKESRFSAIVRLF